MGVVVIAASSFEHYRADSSSSHYNSNFEYSIVGIALILLVVVLQRWTAASSQYSDGRYSNHHTATATEAKRRFQHGITGCILVAISCCIPIYLCIFLLIVATYIIYHIKTYHFHTIYIPNFGPLLREYEKHPPLSASSTSSSSALDHHTEAAAAASSSSSVSQIPLPGAFYFLLGTTMTTILFPLRIARYSVLCLSLADPMAAYIGQSIASYRLDQLPYVQRLGIVTNATVSGCLACFSTAWMIGYVLLVVMVDPHDTAMSNRPILMITAGALACCIAEAIPFRVYGNDNVQIPVLTALMVTIVSSW